jgi:hypothetical protein
MSEDRKSFDPGIRKRLLDSVAVLRAEKILPGGDLTRVYRAEEVSDDDPIRPQLSDKEITRQYNNS